MIRPDGLGRHRGFDITGHVRALCTDISARLPEMRHVDIHRMAFSFSQVRKRSRYGMWASLTPMRFADGALVEVRHRHRYTFQRMYDASGREMLYILTVYLPRFSDLSFREKLVTIFHELWHINPGFNGDLRRHPGRCYAHTHSQHSYDAVVEKLANSWLALLPPESVYDFLRYSFVDLARQYGGVYGAAHAPSQADSHGLISHRGRQDWCFVTPRIRIGFLVAGASSGSQLEQDAPATIEATRILTTTRQNTELLSS